jgi:hypothetical protein
MQKHFTSEIEDAADAEFGAATDAVTAAIQFVRAIAEEHPAPRIKTALRLPFGAERKAEVVDDAISSVAESAAAEYVEQIVRGAGPPERQQFSLGSQLSWNAGRALPQFLFEGKPILLTDPEQVARWDRLAKQEAQQKAPGPMAQIFKAQRKPAPPNIAAELEKSAEGKIIFQSAGRLGWDKEIYYHAGEKEAAERLADILSDNQELTEQQQSEVWRLEGWPEADVARELERTRHVQRMHDESWWWTPQPSRMERARQVAKSLLPFGRAKETVRKSAKAEPEQPQRLPHEIQRAPEPIAKLPRTALLDVEGHAEAKHIGGETDMPPPKRAVDAPPITGFLETDMPAVVRPDLNRARTGGDARTSAGVSRQDEHVFRWLEAAMEDVHRHKQGQRLSLKRTRV